jgi:futalosine hydrolase
MQRTLVLVPTQLELNYFPSAVMANLAAAGVVVEICGFGPIVSAVRSSRLMAEHRPEQVILCGVAGGMHSQLIPGEAYRFGSVACYGIGAGSGPSFQTAAEVGWRQGDGISDNDILPLAVPSNDQLLLLSVCAASASVEDVRCKLEKFPAAVAEDMEGFSVAIACIESKTPLQIVRGISNIAGDRNHRNWKLEQAVQAAAALVEETIFA